MDKPTGYALFTLAFLVAYLLAACIHHRPLALRRPGGGSKELCAVRCVSISALLAVAVAAVVYALGRWLQRCREGEAARACALR